MLFLGAVAWRAASPVRCLRDYATATGEQFNEPAESNNFFTGASAVLLGALFGFVSRRMYQAADNLFPASARWLTGNYTYSITPEWGHLSSGTERGFLPKCGETLLVRIGQAD